MSHPGQITLTILPDNRLVRVARETSVLDALVSAGLLITTPCGRQASCAKCRVVVSGGISEPEPTERLRLTEEEIEKGTRLSCQARLIGDTTVIIPSASRATEMRILVGGLTRQIPFDPSVVKKTIDWSEEHANGQLSKFEALRSGLDLRDDLVSELDSLRMLAALHDAGHRQVTGVVYRDRLIAVEPGDTTERCYGVALDVGTTTVVGLLVDLTTGRDLGTAAGINGQTRYGHDVISRIQYSLEVENGLDHLQEAVITTIGVVLDELLQAKNLCREDIYEIVVVGNTTMTHLLLGISPRSLGFLPFSPVFRDAVEVNARDVGIRINCAGRLYVLPSIAGFIGADTIAALLAAGMDDSDQQGVHMLADVGTNCEIVLRLGGRLIACSTPAGPAFEGMRITHGMYAGPGAIEKITLGDSVRNQVIGRGSPKGICGSGLVDLGAELLRVGLIDETGRLAESTECKGAFPVELTERLIEVSGERQFVLATDDEGRRITLTQGDIRELQAAKAAIRSGIEALLDAAGVKPADLSSLSLAGGFGNYLSKTNTIRLGLLPKLPEDRIRFIGNAAVVGAKMALLSRAARRHADRIAGEAEHLKIAETPNFQDRYVDAMLFDPV